MRALLACDLDRTLIYSPKAFWLETADADAPPIVVSEIYRGVPISFMTRASEALLRELRQSASFVPVTTRTVAQYRRVQLPGPVPTFAVAGNGGVILADGVEDAAWSDAVRTRLTTEAAPLAEVAALLTDPAAARWVTKVNNADDLFVYAIVDRDALLPDWLHALELQCLGLGWAVSLQGRKLYCVPRSVTKSEAVAEVRLRLAASTVLAAGDSLLDQRMLEEADAAFRPAHGELHDAGFAADNLTVTSARGILAGEELLTLLTHALRASLVAPDSHPSGRPRGR